MPKVGGALRKLRWSVVQRGWLGTARFAFGRFAAKKSEKPGVHPFDIEHGLDTSGLIGGSDLGTGHAHDMYNTAYYGMSPSRFRGAMDLWRSLPPLAPQESYTFVDLGCGKGRAVLLAAQMHFREVVGVEIHPELAEIARRNLRSWLTAGKVVSPTHMLCRDATEMDFPTGPCLLYLFNPFARPVVEQLLRRIEISFADRAGLLDIAYFNPECSAALQEFGGFRLMFNGTIAMSEEDAAADLVASPDDLCHLYRWVGRSG